MRQAMHIVLASAVLAASTLVAPRAAAPIRIMLLDGESAGTYHKWQLTTPVLKKQLDETGYYLRIWRRAPSGIWLVLLDLSNPVPKK